MSESRSNPVWRFLVGLWRLIDFANHLVFNVVMLSLLFMIIATITLGMAARSGNGAVHRLSDKTALVLDLDGTLVEQYTSAPLSRALARASGNDRQDEFQLRDLLKAVAVAKTDPKIERLVLKTDGFNVAGFAALREFGVALRDFRNSGKKILAYGTMMEQKQYYLAAQADEVFIDPEGGLILEGLGRYRLYYREALQDKLGIDVHLFRVGEFKSAAEPYILDAASPESREADLFWMNDLWQRYLADIASARRLKPEDLTTLIQTFPTRLVAAKGDVAQLALDDKLIDGLKTPDEINTLLTERGARDSSNTTFRQIGLLPYLAQHRQSHPLLGDRDEVAVVVAQGEISDGTREAGTVGGDSTSELIRQAREDDNVKALVLRVDSPGGSVFPSEQIRREIALVKEAGKPVVVSMGNVAASGGYWISMNADRIYADPSTITGSIGIFGLWMSMPRALEKIGVHSDGVGTTPLAGAFDITRPLDPMAGQLVQSIINHGYAQFIDKVAMARGSTPQAIDLVARGRVWSGAQAHERGLVDTLGGLADAQIEAARLAKLKSGQYDIEYIEKPMSAFDRFFINMSGNTRLAGLIRQLGWLPALDNETAKRLETDLSWLQGNRNGNPIRAVAHCLCGL